ncbi:hypothetical protein Q7P37_008650 [Cladosporium fusiforme]
MCCRRRNAQRQQHQSLAKPVAAATYNAHVQKMNEANSSHNPGSQAAMTNIKPQTNKTSNLTPQEKGIPPPAYDEVIATTSHAPYDSKAKSSLQEDREKSLDENANGPNEAASEPAAKMGFFERLRAKKEARRAAWMAGMGGGMGMGMGRGGGCCRGRRGGRWGGGAC